MSDTPPPAEDGQPEDEPTSRSPLLMVGLIIVGVVAFMTINDLLGGSDDSAEICCEITYEVTGRARSVSITMETPSGTSQHSDAEVPLRTSRGEKLTYRFSRGDFVYLSAQNNGDSGTVECKITGSEGQIISQASSRGAYVIAGCDGRAE